MMSKLLTFTVLLALSLTPAMAATTTELAAQVRAAETAFARTMADRDWEAFKTFISVEAVFCGSRSVLRGKDTVAEGWKRYFETAQAPFSWAPEQVEVLESGTLALSSGPVLNPEGTRSGTFLSIWRLETDGCWRIVFDKGCPPCK